jgi:hypothetical protein
MLTPSECRLFFWTVINGYREDGDCQPTYLVQDIIFHPIGYLTEPYRLGDNDNERP